MKGSRIRQREKSNCDIVPTKALANPIGNSRAEVLFQNYLEL